MSRFRRFLVSVSLVLGVLALGQRAAGAVYRGVILIDAASGETVFEENSDYVGPPASMTKIMTFLVVHDQIKAGRLTLQTPVTVTAADARIGGTQVWLKEGETFTVEELLMAMMIQSANDAAHALARTASGSREAFVAAMNERASQLGMTHTTWRTPHGLPPTSRQLAESDLTSPRDLALLARELVTTTDILRYTSIGQAAFGQQQRPQPVMMVNHNHLVRKVRGVDGLKTGYTKAAGFCLTATAERDGRRLIAVMMGSPTSKERDVRMAELLESAFTKLGPAPARTGPLAVTPAPSAPAKVKAEPVAEPGLVITPAPLPASSSRNAPTPAADSDEPPTVRFKLP